MNRFSYLLAAIFFTFGSFAFASQFRDTAKAILADHDSMVNYQSEESQNLIAQYEKELQVLFERKINPEAWVRILRPDFAVRTIEVSFNDDSSVPSNDITAGRTFPPRFLTDYVPELAPIFEKYEAISVYSYDHKDPFYKIYYLKLLQPINPNRISNELMAVSDVFSAASGEGGMGYQYMDWIRRDENSPRYTLKIGWSVRNGDRDRLLFDWNYCNGNGCRFLNLTHFDFEYSENEDISIKTVFTDRRDPLPQHLKEYVLMTQGE